MAQIRQVVSESLQATVRRLLPSQRGFTEDLQASNVIQPIIDLTPTAEGSSLPTDLSRALAHGSQTSSTVTNATNTVLVNTAGFYRVFGNMTAQYNNASAVEGSFDLFDGTTAKILTNVTTVSGSGSNANPNTQFDFNIFLNSGESLRATADLNCIIVVTTRQIADLNGNIVNPAGFTAS